MNSQPSKKNITNTIRFLLTHSKAYTREPEVHGINAHLYPPENIIRTELYLKSRTSDKLRTTFFYELLRASDALAFDRYDLADADSAADDLNCYSYDGHSAVKLSDPVQINVLDALTEAVGISHQKGQSEIQIPERLRGENYWQWRQSSVFDQECENRRARAELRQQQS